MCEYGSILGSPRPRRQVEGNVTTELHSSLTLSFSAIAYPEPGPKGFAWYKEAGVGWFPLLSNEDLRISSSGLQSNLTPLNVSRGDYGHYKVIVTNIIATYVQHLFMFEKMGTFCFRRQNTKLNLFKRLTMVKIWLFINAGVCQRFSEDIADQSS